MENRRIARRLPAAALEVMQRARQLVGAARGGAKRLRSEGPYVAGGLRIRHDEGRRLLAGERYSVDDLTRNVPCWIPWPWGGCKCSDRFGARLGRWQTLAVHDDATSVLVAVKSVFRFEQSYRGADAASLVFQTESEVGMRGFGPGESHWVIEGGVWQSEQMLATLAGRFISAKGRPNQKLIERWFGAMQTRDSVHFGDVGRIRGERMEDNALYLACRRGEKDPRKHFLSMEAGQESLMETIHWMNTREIRSKTYGKWVPMERWETDTAATPLVTRTAADAWVMSPERRRLKITRHAMISCQAVGPLGVAMPLVFSAAWLWEHAGREIDLYFDPMGAWPIEAAVACPKTRKALGTVTCQASFGESRDRDSEMATAIRKTMMSELRCIVGSKRRVIEIRTPDQQVSHRSETDHLADSGSRRTHDMAAREPQPSNRGGGENFGSAVSREGSVLESRAQRGAADPLPPTTGDRAAEPLRSLGRRAAAARDAVPNW